MLAGAIFAATVTAALLGALGRLRRLHEGHAAVAGALACLALGLAGWADLGRVAALTWDATLSLVAIMVLSRTLDAAGAFRWAALHALRRAGGDGRRAFLLVVALSALCSALFTNDGTVLILTPIVADMLAAAGLGPAAMVPFLVANGFVADAFSTPLVSSNLVNILAADFFRLPPARYATAMLVPSLAALAAATALLLLVYRRRLPARLPAGAPDPAQAIRDRPTVVAGAAVLPLVVTALLLTAIRPLPTFAVLGPAAAAVAAVYARRRGLAAALGPVRAAPWRVIAFASGMNVVVLALRDGGAVAAVTRAMPHAGPAALAALAAAGAAIANNLPSTLFDLLLVHGLGGGAARALAVVIGNDVGSKLTPIGSLATLIWYDALRRRGVAVPWAEFLRSGWLLTPPVLAVCVLALRTG